MISETRTKILSYTKNPKSLAAKATISIVSVVVVSVPVVSILTANTNPEPTQNSIVTAESTENPQNEAIENAATDPATTEKPANSTPTASQSTQNSATANNATQNTSTNATAPTPTTDSAPAASVAPKYTDSYPADWRSQCDALDPWSLTKCQSTSYAAWKVNEAFGNMPKFWGDARMWPAKADAANIPRGSTPQLHSVGVTDNFNAFVEAVNTDGTIDISFYNWANGKAYHFWESIPVSYFTTYIYFGG